MVKRPTCVEKDESSPEFYTRPKTGRWWKTGGGCSPKASFHNRRGEGKGAKLEADLGKRETRGKKKEGVPETGWVN